MSNSSIPVFFKPMCKTLHITPQNMTFDEVLSIALAALRGDGDCVSEPYNLSHSGQIITNDESLTAILHNVSIDDPIILDSITGDVVRVEFRPLNKIVCLGTTTCVVRDLLDLTFAKLGRHVDGLDVNNFDVYQNGTLLSREEEVNGVSYQIDCSGVWALYAPLKQEMFIVPSPHSAEGLIEAVLDRCEDKRDAAQFCVYDDKGGVVSEAITVSNYTKYTVDFITRDGVCVEYEGRQVYVTPLPSTGLALIEHVFALMKVQDSAKQYDLFDANWAIRHDDDVAIVLRGAPEDVCLTLARKIMCPPPLLRIDTITTSKDDVTLASLLDGTHLHTYLHTHLHTYLHTYPLGTPWSTELDLLASEDMDTLNDIKGLTKEDEAALIKMGVSGECIEYLKAEVVAAVFTRSTSRQRSRLDRSPIRVSFSDEVGGKVAAVIDDVSPPDGCWVQYVTDSSPLYLTPLPPTVGSLKAKVHNHYRVTHLRPYEFDVYKNEEEYQEGRYLDGGIALSSAMIGDAPLLVVPRDRV